jgi:hypothetical protein
VVGEIHYALPGSLAPGPLYRTPYCLVSFTLVGCGARRHDYIILCIIVGFTVFKVIMAMVVVVEIGG